MIMGYNIDEYVMMNCSNYYSMNVCMTDNNMVYVKGQIIIMIFDMVLFYWLFQWDEEIWW